MEAFQLSQLLTGATVLAGFQLTAFTWRINREVAVEEKGQPTWMTLADGFVAASFLVLVIGVFAAPLLCSVPTEMVAKLLGIAMMLFAASPFVLASHYNLYCSWGKTCCRPRVTKQEMLVAGISALLVVSGASWILA